MRDASPGPAAPVRATPPSAGRRIVRRALASLAFWCVAVGVAWWYFARAARQDVSARPVTDADSYGLPLFAVALWLAIVLLALNVVAAFVHFVRRRLLGRGPP